MRAAFELAGRTAVIATMHGKEQVIEPVLAGFGLRFQALPVIDTDRFGTFTRDIERAGSQREALLAKARAGLDHSPEADFAVASEGAFGPHPHIPLVASGFEMVVLLDRKSGKAVIGRHITTATNFMQLEAGSWAEVLNFVQATGFPDHGIVVMASRNGPLLARGVTSEGELKSRSLNSGSSSATRMVCMESSCPDGPDMKPTGNVVQNFSSSATTWGNLRRLCWDLSHGGFQACRPPQRGI